MAYPPLVASGDIIAASHINAIRNGQMTWAGDVDADGHDLSDLGALTAVTGAFSGALTAASITVTAAVNGATGTFSGALSANSLSATAGITGATGTFSGALSAAATTVSTLTASGAISAVAKNHMFGTNGGAVGTKVDANILFYSISSSNWSGQGVDASGNYWVRAGLSTDQIFRINSDGSTQMPGWTWDHPAKLGTRYMWFDATHRLLVRANVAPTSDSDGVVIGSQS